MLLLKRLQRLNIPPLAEVAVATEVEDPSTPFRHPAPRGRREIPGFEKCYASFPAGGHTGSRVFAQLPFDAADTLKGIKKLSASGIAVATIPIFICYRNIRIRRHYFLPFA